MPEVTRLPGVSAEELVTAVRVHVDRVHDAVRRLGCDPGTAVEVVETSALDLVEVVAARPETVQDAVGWWFARARAIGRRVATRSDLPLGGGLLSADEDQVVLAEALDALPERERVALLLRDAYDLPAVAVGSAIGTDADGALEVVGRARLALVPLLDDAPAPPVPSHAGSLGALARLGELAGTGAPVAARDATVRRHSLACPGCRAVVESQQRAHLLLAGLAVVALPGAERPGLLAAVEEQARALLPSEADLRVVYDEDEEWEDEPRLLSPLLAVLAVVLATALGAVLGVLLSRAPQSAPVPSASSVEVLPPVLADEAAPTVDAPPPPAPEEVDVVEQPLETRVFLVPADPTTAPAPPAEPRATVVVDDGVTEAEPLGVVVEPSSGPNRAPVQVSGAGWPPGTDVVVDYLDPFGRPTGSTASATTDDAGRFTASLTATNPTGVPGRHTVRVTGGGATATATYDAR